MGKTLNCLRRETPVALLKREHLQRGKPYEPDSPKCPFCGEKNTKLF